MRLVVNTLKEGLQTVLMRGSFQWRLPTGDSVALTFDDGPDPRYTERILDVLASHGIKATFFVIGERARSYPQILRRAFDEGHRIASHTQTHRELPSLERSELEWELCSARRVLSDLVGVDTKMVRPPRGRITPLVLLRVRSLGYRVIHWSRTYSDYRQDGLEPLLERIKFARPRRREIVLLHDNNEFTVQALDLVLPRWLESGMSFATL